MPGIERRDGIGTADRPPFETTMIEELERASERQAGRYLVVETGAVVRVQYDLDENGNAIEDRYTVAGTEVRADPSGWECEYDGMVGADRDGSTPPDEECFHVREAKKVERVLFR